MIFCLRLTDFFDSLMGANFASIFYSGELFSMLWTLIAAAALRFWFRALYISAAEQQN